MIARSPRMIVAGVAACLSLTACHDADDALTAGRVPVTLRALPASSSSALDYADLEITVQNRSDRVLQVAGCPGVPTYTVESAAGSGWRAVYGPVNGICQAIYTWQMQPFRPGETIVRRISVPSAGTYRVRVEIADTAVRRSSAVLSPSLSIP